MLLRTFSAQNERRGIVLLAVLIVVVLLTLAAYQYGELMLAEYKASDSFVRSVQARALAESGVYYAAALLSDRESFASRLNNNPWDAETAFRDIVVGEGRFRGYFSVVSPLGPDDTPSGTGAFRYGVIDEAGKINLNGLLKIDSSGQTAFNMLMKLPNMTEEIANSILDWLDPDDTTRAGGAESDYYSSLDPPYRTKNGPLETLEELLFVKGVTPELLFGTDTNRNGILDPDEQQSGGERDLGWQAYLTVYSREQNVNAEGQPRIYVNDQNLTTLYSTLSPAVGEDLAKFIVLYRLYGPAQAQQSGTSTTSASTSAVPLTGTVSTSSQGRLTITLQPSGGGGQSPQQPQQQQQQPRVVDIKSINPNQLQGRPRRNISSIFELAGVEVEIPSNDPREPARRVVSPLNDPEGLKESLPLLFDQITTSRDQNLPARVNVNTAPRAVLLALPGLEEADVDQILAARPDYTAGEAPDPIYDTPAWLLTEANLPQDKLRSLERYVTARTQVYRLQVVGRFESGGPTVRVEAIVDTNRGRPRIVYWRDLSELGRGFALDPVSGN